MIKSRRKAIDDGEEEGGSATQILEDGSLSEASITSGAEDDADAENSDDSGTGSSPKGVVGTQPITNGHKMQQNTTKPLVHGTREASSLPTVTGDTEAMMNGLSISQDIESAEVHFDDLGSRPGQIPTGSITGHRAPESLAERQKREHEEYKKRRDADPAFVPNRGGFFMHDHRSNRPGQNGFKSLGRVAMRGRGAPPASLATRYVEALSAFAFSAT